MTFRLKNILPIFVIVLITNSLCFSQKRDSNAKKKGELTVSQLQEAEFYLTEKRLTKETSQLIEITKADARFRLAGIG